MGVTIRDVAERAGVSVASVSLVLNQKESRISEETKQRIIETADALGYRLKKQRRGRAAQERPRLEKLICVIFSESEDELTEECISGIEDYASVYGFRVFRMFSSNQSARCAEQISLAAEMGASGLIVIPPADMNAEDHNVLLGEALRGAGLPFVLLDKAIYNVFCDFVTADNKQGAIMAVDYLAEAGIRGSASSRAGKRSIIRGSGWKATGRGSCSGDSPSTSR